MYKGEFYMYKCECGKEFNNPQSFNGHKSNCKLHYLAKYNNDDQLKTIYKTRIANSTKSRLANVESKKQLNLSKWISEQHTCENCGKIMTEKFGSGRFCSRACANSRVRTAEVKEKIKQSVNKTISAKLEATQNKDVEKNKKICLCCCKIISAKNKTGLCRKCLYQTDIGKQKQTKVPGGYRRGSGRGKHG
jgi:hypothetical protein